jgi:hypothetical protein
MPVMLLYSSCLCCPHRYCSTKQQLLLHLQNECKPCIARLPKNYPASRAKQSKEHMLPLCVRTLVAS